MSADPQRCVQGWLMAVSFLISAYGSLIIPSVGTLQSQGGNMSVPVWDFFFRYWLLIVQISGGY